jgi:hypothetical protein
VKAELFPRDSVLELNTKKMGNSPCFLIITHMTLFAKRFRSYGILTIDVATEFRFWTEQRQNGSSVPSLRLAKTPKVPNTELVGNSQFSGGLSNGSKRLAIYELRLSETRPVAASEFLGRLDLPV